MDKLKELMNQRKAQMGAQKVVKLGDIEKEKADRYYKEQQELEKKREEKLQRKFEETEEYYKKVEKKLQTGPVSGTEVNLVPEEGGENGEKEPPVAKKEIFKRLRARGEPVTYFGETDWARYERLLKLEKESLDHVKHDEHANVFQKDLELNEDEFKKMMDVVDEDIPMEKLMERLEKNKKPKNYDSGEYKGRKKQSLSEGISKEDKCDDILYWCKLVLKEWEKDLEASGEFQKSNVNSNDAKNVIGQYRQCRRHIKPVFLLLRNREINDEILDALYHIAHFCLIAEYVKAHDKYLEIAIGNAPWPMGVTMVGIHERSGRSKIFSSQIAHILNDETQRKYLQAIKRLMTVAQKLHPADYARNVNM